MKWNSPTLIINHYTITNFGVTLRLEWNRVCGKKKVITIYNIGVGGGESTFLKSGEL